MSRCKQLAALDYLLVRAFFKTKQQTSTTAVQAQHTPTPDTRFQSPAPEISNPHSQLPTPNSQAPGGGVLRPHLPAQQGVGGLQGLEEGPGAAGETVVTGCWGVSGHRSYRIREGDGVLPVGLGLCEAVRGFLPKHHSRSTKTCDGRC